MTVLVVGAGPTGLTAALELARRGIKVRIVERRAAPSPLSRAVGITRQSLDLLSPSGAADAIRNEALVFKAGLIHAGTRLVARLPLNFDDRSRIWGLPQDRTEHHLAQTLERHGGQVEYGVALEGFHQDAGGITARLSTGEFQAEAIVGADGVHSTVRRQLEVNFPGYDLPDHWSIADVTSPDWPNAGAFSAYLLPARKMAVVVPLAPDRYRVVAAAPDALAALPVPIPVARMHRADSFQISVRQADRFAVGRAFLAGDAAHCHSPVGGRGMNLGIADAADLAMRIAEGRTQGYHAARHAAAARVIADTERIRRLIQGGPAARALVRTGLALTARVPALGRGLARRLAGG